MFHPKPSLSHGGIVPLNVDTTVIRLPDTCRTCAERVDSTHLNIGHYSCSPRQHRQTKYLVVHIASRTPQTHPITDDYEILWDRKLGTGINGAVVVCRLRASGELFALKFLRNRKESRREIALHFKCAAHPNVVKVFAAYSNVIGRGPRDGKAPQRSLLLVMEMMRGGELFDRVIEKQSLTEAEASAAMRQVVEALRYCHSLDVAHRDLKPENLLYASKADDALLKLSDFGFAKIDRGDLVTPVYTPYYVPPQILAAQTAHRARKDREAAAAAAAAAQGGACAVVLAAGTGAGVAGGVAGGSQVVAYDKSCDMWSIGVILYILLCGYPPFQSEVPGQDLSESMQRQIHAGTFHFHEQYWRSISDDAKEVCESRGLGEKRDRGGERLICTCLLASIRGYCTHLQAIFTVCVLAPTRTPPTLSVHPIVDPACV